MIGAVGGVTCGAFLDERMGVVGRHTDWLAGMAIQAEIRLRFLQGKNSHKPMGLMTGGAIPLAQRLVAEFYPDTCLLVAVAASLALLKTAPPLKLSAGGLRDEDQGEKHGQEDCQRAQEMASSGHHDPPRRARRSHGRAPVLQVCP